jgi:hypothetical protein
VVPHLGSTHVPSHPTFQRLNMCSSWAKEKGTTLVMYITKLKHGPERVKKTFSMILERVLKWYDGGVENRITSKMIFEIEVFFSSQILTSPFI